MHPAFRCRRGMLVSIEGVTGVGKTHFTTQLRATSHGPVADGNQVLKAPLSVHQVMINGHALCPPLFFARGCDPCRPGTAVQVERPHRSEDERPWTVGGQWNCLETATTVTECG